MPKFKTPVPIINKAKVDPSYFDFEKNTDKELLDKFVKSSGWGFRGKLKDGGFHFSGPDWDESWNPMTRDQVLAELKERKRIDDEDGGDWFDYLYEEE